MPPHHLLLRWIRNWSNLSGASLQGCPGTETVKQVSVCFGIYNYVGGMTTNANPYGAATTWVVSANTWLVTFWFESIPFSLFLGSRRARTSQLILTSNTSHDMFLHKEMPFVGGGGLWWDCFPFMGPQNPQNWAWIGIFKNTKFDNCSFSRSRDMTGAPKTQMDHVTWTMSTQFEVFWSSQGLPLPVHKIWCL